MDVHPNTIRRMIQRGQLVAFRVGAGGDRAPLRIPRAEIDAMLYPTGAHDGPDPRQ